MFRTYLIAVFVLASACVSHAHASIKAVAVDGVGSSTVVGKTTIHDGKEFIKYFVPLDKKSSGVYGVTKVGHDKEDGTHSDKGKGYGYKNSDKDALQMFLRFDMSKLSGPVIGATIGFEFEDLDLDPINDPQDFLEDVQFNFFDGSDMRSLTDTIWNANESILGLPSGVTANLEHGDSTTSLFITFAGDGLSDILNSISDDAFYMRVDFSSKSEHESESTPEYLMASELDFEVSDSHVIPEPSTAVTFFGLAFCYAIGSVGLRKKNCWACGRQSSIVAEPALEKHLQVAKLVEPVV